VPIIHQPSENAQQALDAIRNKFGVLSLPDNSSPTAATAGTCLVCALPFDLRDKTPLHLHACAHAVCLECLASAVPPLCACSAAFGEGVQRVAKDLLGGEKA
jgi:hypothetical protein